MNPLAQAIEFERQKSQQIPVLVNAVAAARGDQRLQAASLLQKLLGTEEMLAPVRDALTKEARRANPIDVLGRLNELQSNLSYLALPAKRLHDAQLTIIRYLQDIGFADICGPLFAAYGDRIAKTERIDYLIEFFNQKYKDEFLSFQIAVQQGLIENELDYHRWIKQGKPVRFEWLKRSTQKNRSLSNLPPVLPAHWEADVSFRPDALTYVPRMTVRAVQ